MKKRRTMMSVFLLAFACAAAAQSFPAKPIELVNSFAAGGANDLNAKALQVAAERIFGQPLIQTFRSGGGGVVGTSDVANSVPDGYKLLLVSSGELTAAPNLAKTAYSLDSFTFLARISSKPYALVVNSKAPWQSAKAMLDAAKASPGKYTIGTTPTGGMFLTAKYFIMRGGVPFTTVPYGGSGPALLALLGGQIDSVWSPLAAAESNIKAGTLRALAVTGRERQAGHPELPTFDELGIDAPYVQWVGVVAPKGLPADRLKFLREAFARITKDPAYLQAAQRLGIDVSYATGEEFEKQVRDEDKAFKALVKDLNLSANK
jgi:tripartite-type tricarboxylate transporter receptor subunit TctC